MLVYEYEYAYEFAYEFYKLVLFTYVRTPFSTVRLFASKFYSDPECLPK